MFKLPFESPLHWVSKGKTFNAGNDNGVIVITLDSTIQPLSSVI